MKTRTIILAASLAAIGSAAFAETTIECTRSAPEYGFGQVCVDRSEPAPVTLKPTANISAQSSSRATSTADASNSLQVGGDSTKSVVAVFPPPSTAVVPQAYNCIVTRSNAGGMLFNALHGASSEQYSDTVCVLQWMEVTATSDTERASIRAEILKRIGVK